MKKYSLWKKIVVGISGVSLVAGGVLTACSSESKSSAIVKSSETTKTEVVSSNPKASGGI